MMQFAWLQRLLAERGIDARYVRRLEIHSDISGRLWLEVECEAVSVDGRPLIIRTPGSAELCLEHHLVPIAGLVFGGEAWG